MTRFSPRQCFILYRIIKAGLKGKELEAFVGRGPSDAQYRAVLILLAVAYGAPDVAASFFRALKKGKKDMGLKEFLNTFRRDWFVLEELNEFGVLCEWLPVVVRYTFQHGSLSEKVANYRARIV